VQFVTPFLSLKDKYGERNATGADYKLSSKSDQEVLSALRQANLFLEPDDRIPLPSAAVKDGITTDRILRYKEAVKVIDKFVKKGISIGG